MTRISWGDPGERFFEAGVDRGVLYVDDAEGVPWNGLISVAEAPTGGETTPYYVDGVKYFEKASNEEFEAEIEAYTYPVEFSECDGTKLVKHGLFATQQARKSFGLSYRTGIGNDTNGVQHGYKIHVVYNATAAPTSRENSTIGDTVDPFNFTWKVTTRPPRFKGYKPTAHFVIDSREAPVAVLETLENILYGNFENTSRLPSAPELLYIFESFNSSFFDAGTPIEPYYATFDGGPPISNQTSTVDGGTP